VVAPAVAPRYRPQRIRVAAADRLGYAVAGAFAGFAVFGLFTSLAPSFVAGSLHHPGRLLAGVVVFLAFGAATTTQAGSTLLSPAHRFTTAWPPRPPAWSCRRPPRCCGSAGCCWPCWARPRSGP
jgi:hypothetical protein